MITPEQVMNLLEEHTNVLLYGPPGTGKSHLMKQVENLFMKKYQGVSTANRFEIDTQREREAISEAAAPASNSRWVTFHQGYSYEDFIIGLRPTPTRSEAGGNAIMSLEAQAGALLELTANSRRGYGLILIDEVNRGNASRIFGEFITLLEADKRLSTDGRQLETTVTVTLPYLAQGQTIKTPAGFEIQREFQMPRHIYTLASMNSVDKSVAPIDAAIRRRFYLCQLRPTNEDWEAVAGVSGAKNAVAGLAVQIMRKINRGIGLHLGPDYMFGHHYLPTSPNLGQMSNDEAKNRLVSIWRHKILPQLVEFFHARPKVCLSVLEVDDHGDGSGLGIVNPNDDEVDAGASVYVYNGEAEKSNDEIYKYLERFAAGKRSQPHADA